MSWGAASARGGTAGGAPPALVAAGLTIGAAALGIAVTDRSAGTLDPAVLALVPLAVAVTWMLLTTRPEWALAVLLVYLGLCDGVLKLSVSPGNELPGLGRDLLLYAVAVGMVVRGIVKKEPLQAPPMTAWVLAFVAVVLVQLLNPDNWSTAHSFASLRQHLEFVPLFFIAYTIMRSERRLRAFLVLILAVAAVNGAVSLVQFNLSPEQLASWGPGYEDLIMGDSAAPRTAEGADGKKRTRPMALGSDMGFGGTLGALALPAAFALMASGARKWRHLVPIGVLGTFAIIGVATSQSRSAVLAAIIGVFAFAVLATASRQALKALAGVAVLSIIAVFALMEVDSGGSFVRYESITPNRVVETTLESRSGTYSGVGEYLTRFPLGAGIGSVGPAAGVIDPPPDRYLDAESQVTFLIVELGIPGLLVLVAFHLKLLTLILTRIRRLASGELRLLLSATSAPFFAMLSLWFVGVNTVSTPNAPYLWFLAGTLAYWLCGPTWEAVRGRRAGRSA